MMDADGVKGECLPSRRQAILDFTERNDFGPRRY